MQPADRSGEVLDGKYRLVSLLGAGGMGSVYEAVHVGLGKKVAVKFLHRELTGDPSLVARFQQEARAAAAIGHRSIIDVTDIGTAPDGAPFLVMEMLAGESLRGLLGRTGVLTPAAAVDVLLPVLSALAAAHHKGIVHRDLKPDNVFLARSSDGETIVKLLDFGIAKVAEGGLAQATRTGATLGTPHYMSPEQARGQTNVDARADVYAVGVMLYEMLTGRVPYDAANYNALMVKILSEPPPPPRTVRADVPAALEAVVLRAMDRDAARRYASSAALFEALQPWSAAPGRVSLPQNIAAEGGGHASPEATAPTQASSPRRPRPRGVAIAVAAMVLAVLVATAVWSMLGASADPVAPLPFAAAPTVLPATAATVAPALPEAVTISLVGLPEGAKVFFDGAEATTLPLRVARRDVMVPLRVDAGARGTMSKMIAPDHDQEVQVDLTKATGSTRRARARRSSGGGSPTWTHFVPGL